jgi:hypothetical protein
MSRSLAHGGLRGLGAAAPVADAIPKELRRRTGQNVEVKEVIRLLTKMVLRPECLS